MRLSLTSISLLIGFGHVTAASILDIRQTQDNSTSDPGAEEASTPTLAFVLVGDTTTGTLIPPESEDVKATSSGWSAGFCAALSNVPPELCLSFAPTGPAPADNTNPDPDAAQPTGGSSESADGGDAVDENAGSTRRLLRRQAEDNSTTPVTAATSLTDETLFPAALSAIKELRAQGVSTVYVTLSFGNDDERAGTAPGDMLATVKTMIQAVKDAGGVPILVTTMTRRGFGELGTVTNGLRPYASGLVELSHEEMVTAVDFHWASVRLCNDIGEAYCTYFGLTVEEDTYLNNDGSALFGRLSAELVKSSQPLGTVGLTPNWELRSQIARYISMGRVNELKDDAAGTAAASVTLIGVLCMIGSLVI